MTSREKLHELLKTSGCPTWFQDNCLALADEVRGDAIRECISLLNTVDLSPGPYADFVAIDREDYKLIREARSDTFPNLEGYDMEAISSEVALDVISKLEKLVMTSAPGDEEAQRLCAEGVKKCAPVCHHFGSNKKPGPVVAAAVDVGVGVGIERKAWVFGVSRGNKEKEQFIRRALDDGWTVESHTHKKIIFARPKR